MGLVQAAGQAKMYAVNGMRVTQLKMGQLIDLFSDDVAEHYRKGAREMETRSAHSGGGSRYSEPSSSWGSRVGSGSTVPSGGRGPNTQAIRKMEYCNASAVWKLGRNMYSRPPPADDFTENVTR
jgi:hypothetical protein